MIAALWLWWACGAGDCGDACRVGEVCEEGVCVQRSCATSTQCPLGTHCGPDGECLDGCEAASDCLLGQDCLGGVCVEGLCDDAAIDCAWGEWCLAGACVPASDDYCRPCTDDDACGGALCWADEWCAPGCQADGACPAGFVCTEVEVGQGTQEVCLSACWLMVGG